MAKDHGLSVKDDKHDTTRACTELGREPARSVVDAFTELLAGIRDRAGIETPPLARDAGDPRRTREFRTGVGGRAAA